MPGGPIVERASLVAPVVGECLGMRGMQRRAERLRVRHEAEPLRDVDRRNVAGCRLHLKAVPHRGAARSLHEVDSGRVLRVDAQFRMPIGVG